MQHEARSKMSKEERDKILANLKRDRELRRKREEFIIEKQESMISAIELSNKEESKTLNLIEDKVLVDCKDIKEDIQSIKESPIPIEEEEVQIKDEEKVIEQKECLVSNKDRKEPIFKFDENSRIAQEIKRKYQRPLDGIMISYNLSPNNELEEECLNSSLDEHDTSQQLNDNQIEENTKVTKFFSVISSPECKHRKTSSTSLIASGHKHIKVISGDADRTLITSEQSKPVNHKLFVEANRLLINLKEFYNTQHNDSEVNKLINDMTLITDYKKDRGIGTKDSYRLRTVQQSPEKKCLNYELKSDICSKFINVPNKNNPPIIDELMETEGDENSNLKNNYESKQYTIDLHGNEEQTDLCKVPKHIELNRRQKINISFNKNTEITKLTPKKLIEEVIEKNRTPRKVTKANSKYPKVNRRSLPSIGTSSTNLSSEKSKSSTSEQEYTFRPRINTTHVGSHYSQLNEILNNIKQKEREKIKIQKQAKRELELKELSECTFHPETKAFVGYLNRPVVKGLSKYVQRQQRKQSMEKEKRKKENTEIGFVNKYDRKKNHSTVLQPFKLSQRNDIKECTFNPLPNNKTEYLLQ